MAPVQQFQAYDVFEFNCLVRKMTLQKLSFLIFENIISIPPLLLQQPESWQLSKKWKKENIMTQNIPP